jgi:putative hydrolase of the HAD superfamily
MVACQAHARRTGAGRTIVHVKGIIFDVNGTLIDIRTDENYGKIYRFISRYLNYQGIVADKDDIKNEYFAIMREQRGAKIEEHPEYDATEIWREFIRRRMREGYFISPEKAAQLPLFLAELFRGISRRRLKLYPDVRKVLEHLRGHYRLAVLSDAQKAWALPEMRTVGIDRFFSPIVVSGDYGFRKPDRRLFEIALSGMGLAPWEVLYVGNDVYRDVYGPQQLGMKTVHFRSNQGRQHMDGVNPDYVIHAFAELPQAVDFIARTH